MTHRELQRLAALILPLVPQLPPQEGAEVMRLLGSATPPPPPWPYESPPPAYPVAREEHPLAHLENDPFTQIGPRGA